MVDEESVPQWNREDETWHKPELKTPQWNREDEGPSREVVGEEDQLLASLRNEHTNSSEVELRTFAENNRKILERKRNEKNIPGEELKQFEMLVGASDRLLEEKFPKQQSN